MSTYKNDLASNIAALNESLSSLIGSKITDEEYRMNTENLLGCVEVITDSILLYLEYIDKGLERKGYRDIERFANDIRERAFKATTLIDVIKERVFSSDYTELDNLFCYYRHIKEQAPDCILTASKAS